MKEIKQGKCKNSNGRMDASNRSEYTRRHCQLNVKLLSIYLSIYLYLSTYLSVYPSIYLSFYISTKNQPSSYHERISLRFYRLGVWIESSGSESKIIQLNQQN